MPSTGEKLLGIAARSLIRHAVVGVLTGGIGNVALLVGDAMDAHDTFDVIDAASACSDSSDCYSGSGSSSGVHFGANGDGGFYQSGSDYWGNQVNQSSTGAPYLASDPSTKVDPNSVYYNKS